METTLEVITSVGNSSSAIGWGGWVVIIFLFIMTSFFFWRWQVEHYTRIKLQKRLDRELVKRLVKTPHSTLKTQNRGIVA